MEFGLDLFYICSVIFHLFGVGKSTSEEEDENSVGGKRRKWTSDEEVKLIFFDVSTDTGIQGHFNRIKKEWRREFPKSKVTDDGLRNKLHKLRHESSEEGELRKYFKWNPELDRELTDLYQTLYPHVGDAHKVLEEEWKKRHPEFQATRRYLHWRALRLLKKYNHLRYETRGSSRTTSHGQDKEIVLDLRHQWTEDEKAMLLHIDELTDTGEPRHFNRIKLMWREKFPDSKLTDRALHTMLCRLRQTSRKEGERQKFLAWTPEEEKLLLDTYLNTYPYRKDVNMTFRQAWKQRQKGPLIGEDHLMKRIRRLLKDHKYPEYSAQALSIKKLQSDNRAGPEPSYIKRFKSRGNRDVTSEESEEGSRAGTSRMRNQKENQYQMKMKSLNKHLGARKGAESGKRAGKAPIVYDSDASTSSPPTMMSEDSE